MTLDPKLKLSRQHEADIAEALGCRRSKGSGNQWHNQTDGRGEAQDQEFAWAFDCKAAMPGTKGITVTRVMLAKLREQAHHERPLLPLRWYDTERGGYSEDWVLVRRDDFVELLEKAGAI